MQYIHTYIHTYIHCLQVLIDDLLVFTGVLPKASLLTSGILPTVVPPLRCYSYQLNDTLSVETQ